MTNLEKAKVIIRSIKRSWENADQTLMRSTADLAAEEVRAFWIKKEWEDKSGGIGYNPRDRGEEIKQSKQRVEDNRAERNAWQEVYDYAVEKFLETGV